MTNKKSKKSKRLMVDGKITKRGLDIIVNKERFSIVYPPEVWKAYPRDRKEILKDNIAYSSTLFLPQILGLDKADYKTKRPISETFMFMNGIKDMSCCAISDRKSSIDYLKKFFNTQYSFASGRIKTPKAISLSQTKDKIRTAVIPFSFGKDSALSYCLCKELGIKPILISFLEPSNLYEYKHKKRLVRAFEKETGNRVNLIKYGPGVFRYGHYWGLNTELGWGLQTTEYVLLSLPFVFYHKADCIILGNEKSCEDIFFDKEDVLVYKAGYDQFSSWTPQQGLLASFLLGRSVEVISFLEPLYEIAINKILHTRYPFFSKYQISCMVDNENAKKTRWCQHCIKCGYMYALCCAFNLDLKKIGFTENLFDKKHSAVYHHFFNYDPKNPIYGSKEELGIAFYLSYLSGFKGESIDRFRKMFLPHFEKNKRKYLKYYLGIHQAFSLPQRLKDKILKIYSEELKEFTK